MLKFATLTVFMISFIRATRSREQMASALVAAEDTGTLEETFKKYEKEQDDVELSYALVDVASVQARMPKVVSCLRVVHDVFPNDKSRVRYLVHGTLFDISLSTDTESFADVITSFKPSDIKLLASIRHVALGRDDAVNVLKRVMDKYPALIIDDLPSWIAFHSLDRNSMYYGPAHEEIFQYLTSFTTEDVLEKALTIVKRSERYTVAYKNDHIGIMWCKKTNPFPQDLFDKLNVLLALVKVRNARIKKVLKFLPTVLVDMVLEHTTCDTD